MDSLRILLSEAINPEDREFEEIKISVCLQGIRRQREFYREYDGFFPAQYVAKERGRLAEVERRMVDKLVRMTIPMAVKLARKFYRPGGSQVVELAQVAMIGISKVAKRFDHNKGRLSTYAWQGALSSLLYHVRCNASHHPVHIPSSQLPNINIILNSMEQFCKAHGYAPSLGETRRTVQRLGHDPEIVDILWPWIKPPVSLDAKTRRTHKPDRANGRVLYDTIPSQDIGPGWASGDGALVEEIEGLLLGLPPNQARAVQLYYGLPGAQRTYTTTEIGNRFGRTQQWASGILKRGRLNLKRQIEARGGLVGDYINV